MLEGLAEAFRKSNDGMDCRWVYDPKTKPELSNVMDRMADGYQKVLPSEIQGAGIELDLELSEVRVADVILMKIPRAQRVEILQQRVELANEAARSIDRHYHNAIEEASEGLAERHRSRPLGRVSIEERTLEYEVEQRTGEEGN